MTPEEQSKWPPMDDFDMKDFLAEMRGQEHSTLGGIYRTTEAISNRIEADWHRTETLLKFVESAAKMLCNTEREKIESGHKEPRCDFYNRTRCGVCIARAGLAAFRAASP